MRYFFCFKTAAMVLAMALLSGCASLVTNRLAGNLSDAIINQDDPQIVRDGAPAYLLLVDGLIQDSPHDVDLLEAGARLYGAYSAVFVSDPQRARHMAAKARDYAKRALCLSYPDICKFESAAYDRYIPTLQDVTASDVGLLYVYGVSWAGWIQASSGDWNAIAELPKVEAVLQRVAQLDNTYADGEVHLYLGILNTILPPALGGHPDVGERQFEEAIAISKGKNLMAKVEYARRYARLVFDKKLHDRLLHEVLAANPHVPGLTLSNVLAQQDAAKLLKSSAQYFGE